MSATTAVRTEGQVLTGSCKAWMLRNGYGFAKLDDGGPDLMMHQSTITVAQEASYRAIAPGTPVEVTYGLRDGKPCAMKVTGPGGAPLNGFSSKLEATQTIPQKDAAPQGQMGGMGAMQPMIYYDPTTGMPMMVYPSLDPAFGAAAAPPGGSTGVVKWYNRDRGFGFITPSDGTDQLYFKGTGIADALSDGIAVTFTKKTSADKTTGQIKSWAQDVAVAAGGGAKRPAMSMQEIYGQDPFAQDAKRMKPGLYDAGTMASYGALPMAQMYDTNPMASAMMNSQPVYQELSQAVAPADPGMPPQQGMSVAQSLGYPMPLQGAMGGEWGAGAYGAASGTVKFFNTEKGFGFLIPADGSQELYFKGENVTSPGPGGVLTQGQVVTYEKKTADGKSWAVNIANQ